ncbi:MAG: hypothetical protein V4448_17405 [Pseudomonadota bacterium]
MKLLQTSASLVVALIALSGCDGKSSSSTSAPAANPPVTSNSAPAVTPTPPSDMPSSVPGTGPAEGGTAIGGMVGHQGKDGAKPSNTPDTPAPTGGDGSTPKPASSAY